MVQLNCAIHSGNLRNVGYWETALAEAYPDARKLAIKESQRAKFWGRVRADADYPQQCPFSQAQLLDDDFYCAI